jgi:integrase/recombinase XerD
VLKQKRVAWRRDRAWEFALAPVVLAVEKQRGVLTQFALWLRDDRRLKASSIGVRVRSARDFIRWVAGDDAPRRALRALCPRSIEEFFVHYRREHGPAAQRSMQAAMRLFLRHAEGERLVPAHLAEAVPVLYVYKLADLPRGLDDSQITATLATSDVDAASARDRAILLLLATYGIRRGQISRLELHDIDWEGRRIRFAEHKGGKAVEHVLTSHVSSALARYVDEFRPRASCTEVFVRAKRPFLALGPGAITQAVRARVEAAGVTTSPAGPHAFRHAFATRLLRRGRSLKVVADLLGHRHIDSSRVYGKVDVEGLRQVAAEWPVVLR